MRKTLLKQFWNFPIRWAIAVLSLVAGVTVMHFVPSRGNDSAFPEPSVLAQSGCNGDGDGNNGTPHPCSEISCGDYMCPCDPGPGDCYYAWGSGCYNF